MGEEDKNNKKIPQKMELSPVEKIISVKYGDIGLRVYAFIDGQRTAEEVMRETGLTEPKLVEILDFMDEQGIIKLDYPKNQKTSATQSTGPANLDKIRKILQEYKEYINSRPTDDQLSKLAVALQISAFREWRKIEGLQKEVGIDNPRLMALLKALEKQKIILLNYREEYTKGPGMARCMAEFNEQEKRLYDKTSAQFGMDGICLYLRIDNKTPLGELEKNIPEAKQIIKILINEKLVVFDPFGKQRTPCLVKKSTSNFPPLIYSYRSKEDLKTIKRYSKGFVKSIKYYELGVFSRAAEELEKSRAKDAVYYVNHGVFLLMNDNCSKEAIEDFTKALDIEKNNYRALYNRAIAQGTNENSFSDVNRAIGLKSDNPLFYILRGKCFEYGSSYSSSVRDYGKALDLKPDFELAKKYLEEAKGKIPLEKNKDQDLNLPKIDESVPKYKLSDVGGNKKLKEGKIGMKLTILKHPEKAKEFDLFFGGGIVFYGPYGCGKTYISEAIAGEAEISFFKAEIPDIINKWAGNSEKILHSLFETARRKQPSIIFFDEIESLGGSREEINEHWGRVFTNQFLKEMDEIKKNKEQVLVIGATNAPWHMDPALMRTGRFSDLILIPAPDEHDRKEIFKIHTREITAPMDVDLEVLAKITDGLSGSNIQHICERIREEGLKEALKTDKAHKITTEDFIQIIEEGKKEGKFNDVKKWLEMAKRYDKLPPKNDSNQKDWAMFG
ncbi:Proteasome-activating nucleotidase [Candidatus Bilamarchaeum dharawalense]|uniref:Proteasome-activating nucleotidase n=1 Tax=Candidatus Bilamarchaeum dharawalense TaxID=2885759 RepID=A0A5E4LPU3_9ARCH|nr:Proteasome-activating nucleotidase [Candidatus Bilamarchaeum dharawalense]